MLKDRFEFNLECDENRLGSGAFGQVIKGTDKLNNTDVAIKLEPIDSKYPQLEHEARIYQTLQDNLGVPNV